MKRPTPKSAPRRAASVSRAARSIAPAVALPDRSALATEQRNPRTRNLHAFSVPALVALIQREDAALPAAMAAAAPALAAFIAAVEPRFTPRLRTATPGRLIYLGAGTSGRLGVLDASEAPPTFQLDPGRIIGLIAGGDPSLRRSSEGKEDNPRGALPALAALRLTPRDTILAIAAGGTTPYALGALVCAKQLQPRVLTAILTCAAVPSPPRCDHLIIIPTGPEVLTGSTRMKAGTATKLALNTISTALMVRSGRVFGHLMVDLRATNAKLRDRAARIVSAVTGADRATALAALDAAGGSAKVAIVMLARQASRTRAERLLSRARGRLDAVIGAPQ
ncbi:N-acetylmuramic acid 6-phosphate etherase [soil metagenome]